jgi:L-fuculose-phosphate aldolase
MNSSSVDLTGLSQSAALTRVMHALEAHGFNRGAAGNASVRTTDGLLITPTGVRPRDLVPHKLVGLALSGAPLEQGLKPSSEWRMHRDVYVARPEIGAIVHVHSPFATALACARRAIPAFHYMIAQVGGDSIRCADYATFGTQALSDVAVAALAGRRACLLANHGMLALGATLQAAYDLTVAVEDLAHQYCLALQCGPPVLLTGDQMREVQERFGTYGQQ